jgi:hypothetical protein
MLDATQEVAATTPTKRNHYVPQFLQEYFVDDDGNLWVYDKDGGDPRRQKPIDTGVEKFLYTVRKKDGQHDDSLERYFAGLEGATKPILDRLIQPGSRITEDEKPLLAQFMAFMHTRVPRSIEAASEMGSALWLDEMRELAADDERFNALYAEMLEEHPEWDMPSAEVMRQSFDLLESGELEVSVNRQVALGASLNISGALFKTLMGSTGLSAMRQAVRSS